MKTEYDITERHVQAIWYDRDLRPVKLFTRDGECVRVVHPGEWNQTSGPDFKGAVLEIGLERRRLVGDVEIHLSPSDWDAHDHGHDPAYRNVVAHVTWRDGEVPKSLPQDAVSIWLGRFLASDMGFSPESIDVGAYPFDKSPTDERPCRRRAGNDPERARRILVGAGSWRLKAKAERMAGLLRAEDYRQVFYSEVMNALGYGKNSAGFRTVAAAVPYAAVAAEPDNAAAAFLAAAAFVDWNRDHVRPSNSPELRLGGGAAFYGNGCHGACRCPGGIAGRLSEGVVRADDRWPCRAWSVGGDFGECRRAVRHGARESTRCSALATARGHLRAGTARGVPDVRRRPQPEDMVCYKRIADTGAYPNRPRVVRAAASRMRWMWRGGGLATGGGRRPLAMRTGKMVDLQL